MEFITVQGKTYEEAVSRLRELCGDQVRVHSRRELPGRGLFGTRGRSRVEVSGYLPDVIRSEDPSPEPESESEPEPETEGRSHAAQPAAERDRTDRETEQKQEILQTVRQLMHENGFSSAYTETCLNKVLSQCSDEERFQQAALESRILGYIRDSLPVDRKLWKTLPPVTVLLGPAGVGKTTTTAKIAARYQYSADGDSTRNVSIISMDMYRIGAGSQIETFGEILEIPTVQARTPLELDSSLRALRDQDLILIDTIGKSPADKEVFEEMQRILSVCPGGARSRFFLVLPASMKTGDMLNMVDLFRPLRVSALIITKMDETESPGSVLSVAAQTRLPLVYISNGQKVPQDLLPAEPDWFLSLMKGFSVGIPDSGTGVLGSGAEHYGRLFS